MSEYGLQLSYVPDDEYERELEQVLDGNREQAVLASRVD